MTKPAEGSARSRPHELSRPQALPPRPWRYTITPSLVRSLEYAARLAGELRALPLSYYKRKELEARARRLRIVRAVSETFSSVREEEVEAVLRGARLAPKREGVAHAIRCAAVVEDALTQFARPGEHLTPELAVAYRQALEAMPSRDDRLWLRFSGRERAKLLELHRGSVPVPPEVAALFEWANEDDLVSSSTVLRAATLHWGLSLLWRPWRALQVFVHHELRAGRYDANGLLILTQATQFREELLAHHATLMADADRGDLTSYFEHFAQVLGQLLSERLEGLGRVQEAESHLPWRMVQPPDALDARIFEVVERLGQAGSATIAEALGAEAPPLRTLQRRLQKLVSDGVLAKHGARKNALYMRPQQPLDRT